MRQQLHLSKINLATEKQMVSDLKAQLLQVKEAARLVREVAEARWQPLMSAKWRTLKPG